MLTRAATADESGLRSPGSKQLDRATLIHALRVMQTSRRIDDREVLLKRQNKIFFQVSAAGHEAIQTAVGLYLRPGFDWFYTYYRDRAVALACGITPKMMMLQAVGAGKDSQSGGRQMPSHWSSPELHVVTGSSPTGSQYVQAIGCAHAGRLLYPQSDEVTVVTSGDGATSEGEFWEAVNAACLEKLPVIFVIEDNGWAISVPVEHQTPGGNISKLLAGFPSLLRLEINGSDFVESWKAMEEAAAHCRAGIGPALVHAHCIRPYSHSLSDDERFYKTDAEREEEARRDPLRLYPEWLIQNGLMSESDIAALYAEIDREVEAATDHALNAPPPDLGTAMRFLYSPAVDPT